ncbi:phosphopyruvate hydratase [Candidatus Dojkabacteria bacterium]|nr:phosphopyruvate hydratase [Candidatus Dojkabacteria bacterium]
MKIKSVKALEILDSRGVPTLQAKITLEDGSSGTGAVPSGASTGSTEAHELRDNEPNRYFGKGVSRAVTNLRTTIADAVVGQEFSSQEEFDEKLIELDGTEYKSNLGGNAILAASMAFCKATAKSKGLELFEYFKEITGSTSIETPQLSILLMEGGKHGDWATDFQEYMIIPRIDLFDSVAESLRSGAEIFKATHDVLDKKNYDVTVGFEGAYAPSEIKSNTEAFEIMLLGIEQAGYKPGEEILLGIDAAASEFYQDGKYNLRRENKVLTSDEWLDLQIEWLSKYPVFSIEDTLAEEDWESWTKLVERVGHKYQIVGDDLLTTNTKRIQKAIDLKAVNSVLIKINQIGSITETLRAIDLAHSADFTTMISHRGGETNDDLIADLVMGCSSWQTKFGGPDRGERLAKYNRLLEIETGF